MSESPASFEEALRQLEETQRRLAEAEEQLQAIRAGEVDAIIATGPDGSEQVYTLQGADYTYRVLVERMNQAAAITSDNGAILFTNAKFEKLTGTPSEKALSLPLESFFPESHLENLRKLLCLSREGDAEGELYLRDSQGRLIPVYASVNRLKLGEVYANFLLLTDISERKEAEEQRTLLEANVFQLQKMEAIGSLAGGIAHDFNNLLGAIIGYTELTINDLPPGSECRENLELVLVASSHARELVRQILTFSRKGARKEAPVEVRCAVEEAMKLLSSTIPKTVVIERDIDPEAVYTVADPTELNQVVMNLCTNAYQALPNQEGKVRVTLRQTEVGPQEAARVAGLVSGYYLKLEVEDNGSGMGPETLERVFEPYFTTKALGKGSGLGLAVVHGIVAGLKGAIDVRSTPGIGTAFTVYLPKYIPETEVRQVSAAPVSASHGGGHVLLVDDEPLLVGLGKRMLEKLGYTVSAVADPLEALSLFKADPESFDLLLTDQTMPGLTGMELMKRARAIKPDIPVVICTGHSDLIDEDGAMNAGAKAFIRKPYDKSLLGSAVAIALGDRH